MRQSELQRFINEAKVLSAIKNGASTLIAIVETTGICQRSVYEISKVLHGRGDILIERPKKAPVNLIHTFIADAENRIDEYLHVDIPESVKPKPQPGVSVYTCEEIAERMRKYPKPKTRPKWGNYGISGSTLGGAYFDY